MNMVQQNQNIFSDLEDLIYENKTQVPSER